MIAVGVRAEVSISQSRAATNSAESMWSAYPRNAGDRSAVCGESREGLRHPPRSRRHVYSRSAHLRVCSSAALPNWGCFRDPGAVRTSTSRRTPADFSSSMRASAVRVPCPTVNTTVPCSRLDPVTPGAPPGSGRGLFHRPRRRREADAIELAFGVRRSQALQESSHDLPRVMAVLTQPGIVADQLLQHDLAEKRPEEGGGGVLGRDSR